MGILSMLQEHFAGESEQVFQWSQIATAWNQTDSNISVAAWGNSIHTVNGFCESSIIARITSQRNLWHLNVSWVIYHRFQCSEDMDWELRTG